MKKNFKLYYFFFWNYPFWSEIPIFWEKGPLQEDLKKLPTPYHFLDPWTP